MTSSWEFIDRERQARSAWSRFELSGNKEDLDSAIAFRRAALDLCAPDSTDHDPALFAVALYLYERYRRWGDASDLECAISTNRTALDMRQDGHPDRYTSLNNTALCLWIRYEREGRMTDLEEAISLHRAVLNLAPGDHPDRSMSLSNTAVCLSRRCEREGRITDLEEAMSLHRAALDLRPDGHPDRFMSLSNTANCIWTRYEREGMMADLEEAISFHRAALDLTPDSHPDRFLSLSNTAICLLRRYEREGRMTDLEEAISLLRATLDLRLGGHPDRSMSLSNTAVCLLARYEREGRMTDLEEAMSLHRAALDLRPDGHPYRSASLNNIALCLWRWYECEGRITDLEEAISLHRAALDLTPEGHLGRSMSLSNTAVCLLMRYKREGRMTDLEEAISLHRAALDLRPDGHPYRSASLSNTAVCLLARYECEGRMADLEEVISLHRTALDLTPDGHPYRSMILDGAAVCLLAMYKRKGRPKDLEEAIHFLSRSAAHAFSGFSSRFQAVRRWVLTARSHDHESLVEGYKCAMSILRSALTTRPSLSEQHKLLSDDSDFQTLALDAASSAIDKSDFYQAVEFLEQGRSLLWSRMRGLRAPLEQLWRVNKSLAERFDDCSRSLEAHISSTGSPMTVSEVGRDNNQVLGTSHESRLMEQLLAQMRQLHEEQEMIIDEIRHIKGFEGFLRAAPFEMLRRAASEGPVIVLNHSRFRRDALIILPREDDSCVCVPLDEEFYFDTNRLHEEFLRIRQEFKVHTRQYDEVLRQVMKFLWDRVVSKVMQKLREVGVAEGSRIWWCPTSVLTAFPFHAAGPYEEDGKMKYLLDDYISSYTPTLTSLINSRSGTNIGSQKMLFVADTRLPSAKKERREILRNRRIDVQLRDKHATPDAVLHELQTSSWVHFVCHGTLDEEPFNSRLNISGEGLKLLDIARANLPNAEFAFLSACHTAEQGPRYALDEALHLAAAMQFCGFKSVVGTTWQVLDRDGPFVSGRVYAFLKYNVQEGEIAHKKAAAAVRHAALRLRERVKEEVHDDGANTMTERWVNLVHIGA